MTEYETILVELRELRQSLAVPTYLKVDKAAEYLSTSENALRVMCCKGQIKFIKKQSKLYFRLSDLIEWFETSDGAIEESDPTDIILKRRART